MSSPSLLLLLLLFLQFEDKAMHLSHACRISSFSIRSVPLPFHAHRSFLQVRLQSFESSSKEHQETGTKKRFVSDEDARTTSSSLLYLLGGREQSESVNPSLAHQIWPYLRFLASPELELRTRRKTSSFIYPHQVSSYSSSLFLASFSLDFCLSPYNSSIGRSFLLFFSFHPVFHLSTMFSLQLSAFNLVFH